MDFPPRRAPSEGQRMRLTLDVEPAPTAQSRPAPPAPGRTAGSETFARFAWALPWIVVIVAAISVGGLLFAAAMAVFACVGLAELFRMGRDAKPFELISFAVAISLVISAYYGSQFQMVIVGAAAFPAMFIAAGLRDERGGVTTSFAFTVFGIGWIAIPFAHAVLLRQLPVHGGALLLDILIGTFLTDTFAYFGGRILGSHKLAPRISPNKTLEGLAVGLVGGTFAFWFAGLYQDWLSGLDALTMGFCVALLAPIGDLFQSMVKRDLGVKDTGRLFGPHGGVLDRLDAVMFTIVAGYYLAVALVY
jgi:phosphatidate cytidylyltransferase